MPTPFIFVCFVPSWLNDPYVLLFITPVPWHFLTEGKSKLMFTL
jgi:hypothetical protein